MKPSTYINRLIPTLYEDEHVLAIAKPAGIDTGGLAKQTVPGLLEVVTELRGDDVTLTAATRLSRYESGVVLFAKSAVMARHIRTGLRSMRIQQEYIIAVQGRTARSRVVIEVNVRPSADRSDKRSPPQRRPTQRRTSSNTAATMRDRLTTLSPIRTGTKRTLIHCRTYAPTTHALRAQLRSVGLRAVGDALGSMRPTRTSHPMTHFHLERLTFFHPSAKRKISVKSPVGREYGVSVLDGQRNIIRSLSTALTKRLPCMSEPDTNCFRLISGPVEDVPGLIAEKYGGVVVLEISKQNAYIAAELKAIARWYRDVFGSRAVYVKDVIQAETKSRRGASSDEEIKPASTTRLLVGKHVDDEVVVVERGLRFAVRLSAGRSVGLFLDQRENRTRIRSMSGGKDVLNLFAYTCGFSVAAAAGGARSTVSVDLSPAALEWGKDNFALNDFDPTGHSFVRSDAKTYLKLATKRGQKFDMVILDPPSFAHGRKRGTDFSIQRDLGDLVAAASAVLSRGGMMMISTNLRRLSATALRAKVREGAGKRRHRVIEEPRLPLDFASDPDYSKSVFVRFD